MKHFKKYIYISIYLYISHHIPHLTTSFIKLHVLLHTFHILHYTHFSHHSIDINMVIITHSTRFILLYKCLNILMTLFNTIFPHHSPIANIHWCILFYTFIRMTKYFEPCVIPYSLSSEPKIIINLDS